MASRACIGHAAWYIHSAASVVGTCVCTHTAFTATFVCSLGKSLPASSPLTETSITPQLFSFAHYSRRPAIALRDTRNLSDDHSHPPSCQLRPTSSTHALCATKQPPSGVAHMSRPTTRASSWLHGTAARSARRPTGLLMRLDASQLRLASFCTVLPTSCSRCS